MLPKAGRRSGALDLAVCASESQLAPVEEAIDGVDAMVESSAPVEPTPDVPAAAFEPVD